MNLIHLKTLRTLTILLAVSLTIVSIAGAFFPGTYARDAASMAAQGIGQDLVDLFLGVPMLLVTFYFAARGKRVALLLYGGILFYIMYSFIIYCFGVHFNQLFLLYCMTLGLSLYAFILLMNSLLLWKRKSLGYIIASIAMVFMIILTIALAAMVVMLVIRDISEDFTIAIVFGVLTVASLVVFFLLFRNIKAVESNKKRS